MHWVLILIVVLLLSHKVLLVIIQNKKIIENDVLEILPDKDYKTRSFSKDLLVSPLDIEDYKESEEKISIF